MTLLLMIYILHYLKGVLNYGNHGIFLNVSRINIINRGNGDSMKPVAAPGIPRQTQRFTPKTGSTLLGDDMLTPTVASHECSECLHLRLREALTQLSDTLEFVSGFVWAGTLQPVEPRSRQDSLIRKNA